MTQKKLILAMEKNAVFSVDKLNFSEFGMFLFLSGSQSLCYGNCLICVPKMCYVIDFVCEKVKLAAS